MLQLAPTTSEWSTSSLPTKVRLILETRQYLQTFSAAILFSPQGAQMMAADLVTHRARVSADNSLTLSSVVGWGLLCQFPPFNCFPNFSALSKHTLNSMFIFERCGRSSAAVAPVKYKCYSNNQTGTFAWLKILLTVKLTNGALVTRTPEYSVSNKTWVSF